MGEAATAHHRQILAKQYAMRLNELLMVEARAALPGPRTRGVSADVTKVGANQGGRRFRSIAIANIHSSCLSVVCGNSTVAEAGGASSASGESPALCTVCDHRLDDVAIRSCSMRACPNAQKDAA